MLGAGESKLSLTLRRAGGGVVRDVLTLHATTHRFHCRISFVTDMLQPVPVLTTSYGWLDRAFFFSFFLFFSPSFFFSFRAVLFIVGIVTDID